MSKENLAQSRTESAQGAGQTQAPSQVHTVLIKWHLGKFENFEVNVRKGDEIIFQLDPKNELFEKVRDSFVSVSLAFQENKLLKNKDGSYVPSIQVTTDGVRVKVFPESELSDSGSDSCLVWATLKKAEAKKGAEKVLEKIKDLLRGDGDPANGTIIING